MYKNIDNRKIYAMYKAGFSYRAIGRKYNISGEAVRQRIVRYQEHLNRGDNK